MKVDTKYKEFLDTLSEDKTMQYKRLIEHFGMARKCAVRISNLYNKAF